MPEGVLVTQVGFINGRGRYSLNPLCSYIVGIMAARILGLFLWIS
jgi:hypothetical protein